MRSGQHHSPATLAKIGAASLGRRHSEATRARMSASQKGRPVSAIHRARLSEANRRFAQAKMAAFSVTFWQRVDTTGGLFACWPWMGPRDRDGYGQVGHDGRHLKAHRVALELTNGPLSGGVFACHTCDNPPCCNPAHLWVGNAVENNRDMIAKGRAVLGRRRNGAAA